MILVHSWITEDLILGYKERCGSIIVGFNEKLCFYFNVN